MEAPGKRGEGERERVCVLIWIEDMVIKQLFLHTFKNTLLLLLLLYYYLFVILRFSPRSKDRRAKKEWLLVVPMIFLSLSIISNYEF